MSSLPNPKEFKHFKMQLHQVVRFDEVITDEIKHSKLINIYKAINSNKNYSTDCIYNILNKKFLDSIDKDIKQKVYSKYLRYDTIEQSPCIVVKDKYNVIQFISVHRAKDGTKWKKKVGSNAKYIHYNIFDYIIFVAYGIGEMLILELLGLSYILLQSDSVANTLHINKQFNDEVKPLLKDKLLVPLLDNDYSCFKTIQKLQENLKNTVKLCLPLYMIDILTTSVFFNDTNNSTSQEARTIWKNTKIVPSKYDFKDYVLNEFNPIKIKDIVFKTIENKIQGVL